MYNRKPKSHGELDGMYATHFGPIQMARMHIRARQHTCLSIIGDLVSRILVQLGQCLRGTLIICHLHVIKTRKPMLLILGKKILRNVFILFSRKYVRCISTSTSTYIFAILYSVVSLVKIQLYGTVLYLRDYIVDELCCL